MFLFCVTGAFLSREQGCDFENPLPRFRSVTVGRWLGNFVLHSLISGMINTLNPHTAQP